MPRPTTTTEFAQALRDGKAFMKRGYPSIMTLVPHPHIENGFLLYELGYSYANHLVFITRWGILRIDHNSPSPNTMDVFFSEIDFV